MYKTSVSVTFCNCFFLKYNGLRGKKAHCAVAEVQLRGSRGAILNYRQILSRRSLKLFAVSYLLFSSSF